MLRVTLTNVLQYCGEFDNWGAVMAVSPELLCSFELLKPLDSTALKNHIKKGRKERMNTLNSPVSFVTGFLFITICILTVFDSLRINIPRATRRSDNDLGRALLPGHRIGQALWSEVCMSLLDGRSFVDRIMLRLYADTNGAREQCTML